MQIHKNKVRSAFILRRVEECATRAAEKVLLPSEIFSKNQQYLQKLRKIWYEKWSLNDVNLRRLTSGHDPLYIICKSNHIVYIFAMAMSRTFLPSFEGMQFNSSQNMANVHAYEI